MTKRSFTHKHMHVVHCTGPETPKNKLCNLFSNVIVWLEIMRKLGEREKRIEPITQIGNGILSLPQLGNNKSHVADEPRGILAQIAAAAAIKKR
jgi:hypothetical protein